MWQGHSRLLALLVCLAAAGLSAAEPIRPRPDLNGQPLPPFAVERFVSQEYFVSWYLTALALSPNGKRLATAGFVADKGQQLAREARRRDPTDPQFAVQLRDPKSGEVLRTLQRFLWCPTVLSFNPAGDVLAVGDQLAITLVDVQSGAKLRSVGSGGRDAVLCFSPDGKYLAASGDRGRIHVWEAATGIFEMERRFRARQIAFSTDNAYLAAACDDGVVRMWSLDSGDEVHRFRAAPANVQFAFLSDGKRIAVLNDKAIDIYHVKSGLPMPSVDLPADATAPMVFTPGGQRLLGFDGGAIDVLDTATGKLVKTLFEKHRAGKEKVAPEEADRPLTRLVEDWLGHQDLRTSVSAQGNLLAMRDATAFRVVDLETGQVAAHTALGPVPRGLLSLSPNGSRLLTMDRDALRLWDARGHAELARLQPPPRASRWPIGFSSWNEAKFVFSPDGRWIAGMDNSRIGDIYIWEAFPGRFVRGMWGRGGVTALAFHADGKHLVAITRSVGLEAWDLETGRNMPMGQGINRREWISDFREARLSPDGRLALVVDRSSGKPTFYDTLRGSVPWFLRTTERFDRGVVEFSPDGKKLLHLNERNQLTIYYLGSDRKEQRTSLKRPVLKMALSPDDKLLAGATEAGAILVIDAATGKELVELAGHRPSITRLQFTPNGETLISWGSEGTILFWDLKAALAAAKPTAEAR